LWLGRHGATYGLAEALITTIALPGLAELLLHAIIDLARARLRFSMAFDQCLHLACKLVWALLIVLL